LEELRRYKPDKIQDGCDLERLATEEDHAGGRKGERKALGPGNFAQQYI
jgi:hypothetical protein